MSDSNIYNNMHLIGQIQEGNETDGNVWYKDAICVIINYQHFVNENVAVNDHSFMQTIQKRAYIYANAQFHETDGIDGYPLIFYTMNAWKDVCIEYTHKFNKDKHGEVTIT